MMSPLPISQQAENMRKRFPSLREISRDSSHVFWEGPVKSLCKAYQIRIEFDLKRSRFLKPLNLRVTVEDPLLRSRTEKWQDIPHIYKNPFSSKRPFLCLFDPEHGEWNEQKSIAHLIVPWTCQWLACYQGWLATGYWACD